MKRNLHNRHLFSLAPLAGLFALTFPASASVSGMSAVPTLGKPVPPLVLAQHDGNRGAAHSPGRAGGSGGTPHARGGPAMGGAARSGPSMHRGSDGGQRSFGARHSDGGRVVIQRFNSSSDQRRVVQRHERDRPRVEHRGNDRPGNRGWIRNHGRHYSWGPGISFWFYNGFYYGDCAWLKRRAIATGSSYWWRRYRQCRSW